MSQLPNPNYLKLSSFLQRTESLSVEFKILQRDKAYVEQKNSELTRALQEKGIEIESLIKQRERYTFFCFEDQMLMLLELRL